MARVAVIGSGPSAVAAASALLDAGRQVVMFDWGQEREEWSRELSAALRGRIDQGLPPTPAMMHLLRQGKGADRGGAASWLSRFFSAKDKATRKRVLGSTFTYDGVEGRLPMEGFDSALSLARGGLSNVWGAGCYPLRRDEYHRWPVGEEEMAPWYEKAADLLDLWQEEDGLGEIYPLYGRRFAPGTVPPRRPASPAEDLLHHWRARGADLAERGFYGGRMRLALGEKECRKCGLCLYGCPYGAVFNAGRVVEALQGRGGFTYVSGFFLHRFRESAEGIFLAGETGGEEGPFDRLFLGAGALSSLRIAADSLSLWEVPRPVLDNDFHALPSFCRLPSSALDSPACFTMTESALAWRLPPPHGGYIHASIYSLNDFFFGPWGRFRPWLPAFVPRLAARLRMRPVILLAFADSDHSRRAVIRVRKGVPGAPGRLCVEVLDPQAPSRALMLDWARELGATGLWPLTFLLQSFPFGQANHIGGTLPMGWDPQPLSTSPAGVLHGTKGVHVVDPGTFPVMPAQNATFVAMANAMRIAHCAVSGHSGL